MVDLLVVSKEEDTLYLSKVDTTVNETLFVVHTLVSTLEKVTGIPYNEILENLKEKEGEVTLDVQE